MLSTPSGEYRLIHCGMADDSLIRRANLKRLKKTPTELSRALGKTPAYYSDLMNKPGKSFGEKAARAIEEGLALSRGWLDLPHGEVNKSDVEGDELSHDDWRMSLSDDPALDGRSSLVDDFADRLLALPAERHDAAVDACRRLAESPDSKRARENLQALIGAGPARATQEMHLEQALGMLADRWPVDGEREVIQRFLETVTLFMAEDRDSPNPGTGTATTGQHTKATTREN
jgi:hypothetical protein